MTKTIGLDLGTQTIKVVVLNDNTVYLAKRYSLGLILPKQQKPLLKLL